MMRLLIQNIMKPLYNLDKIKFATDPPTFECAVKLYEHGTVKHVPEGHEGYSATVLGGSPYTVFVSSRVLLMMVIVRVIWGKMTRYVSI